MRTRDGRHHMSVADVDALLYLPERNIEQLRKIVDVPALSPGWQQSFRELLAAHDGGAASAGPSIGAEPGWNGFQRLRVCEVRPESTVVLSISLDSGDGGALPSARPGQYLTVRIPDAGSPVPMRSYSLSSDSRAGRYRISVKREDRGLVSRWLHDHAEVGTVIEAAAPRAISPHRWCGPGGAPVGRHRHHSSLGDAQFAGLRPQHSDRLVAAYGSKPRIGGVRT